MECTHLHVYMYMYSSLLVASDSPVLLQATCETANSTDASRSIDRSIDRSLDINLYMCAIIGYRTKNGLNGRYGTGGTE